LKPEVDIQWEITLVYAAENDSLYIWDYSISVIWHFHGICRAQPLLHARSTLQRKLAGGSL
jgi:hypothetical protein